MAQNKNSKGHGKIATIKSDGSKKHSATDKHADTQTTREKKPVWDKLVF